MVAAGAVRLQVRRHLVPGRGCYVRCRGPHQQPELAGVIELDRFPARMGNRNRFTRDLIAGLELVFRLHNPAYPHRELSFLVADNSIEKKTIP